MAEAEEWRPVAENTAYEVSSLGQVRGPSGKILKPATMKKGHQQLMLCKDGQRSGRLVHRLVALAFIPQEEGRDQVDRIDGDPKNNAVSNLRWATNGENSHNRRVPEDATHRFEGLTFNKGQAKWQVFICMGGGVKFQKLYDNFPEALAVRNEKKLEAGGKFATPIDISTIDLDSLPVATPFKRIHGLSPEDKAMRVAEQQKAHRTKIVNCECGAAVQYHSMTRHLSSAKHCAFLGEGRKGAIKCECGAEVVHIERHKKSARHQAAMAKKA